jgi:hypothetical protein
MLALALLCAFAVGAVIAGHAIVRGNAIRRDREFFEALAELQAQRSLPVQPLHAEAAKQRRRRAA